MKFNSRLEREKLDEWSSHYVDYKKLKKLLKKFHARVQECGSDEERERERLEVAKAFRYAAGVERQRAVALLKRVYAQQWRLMNMRSSRTQFLLQRGRHNDAAVEMSRGLRTVARAAARLDEFMRLNLTAIRKIFKKFDKYVGAQEMESFVADTLSDNDVRMHMEVVDSLSDAISKEFLFDPTMDTSELLHSFVRSDQCHASDVHRLIAGGAKPNVTFTSAQTTALFEACALGKVDIVKVLLAKGAQVSISNFVKRSALDAAIAGGHEEVAEILRQRGATTDVRPEGLDLIQAVKRCDLKAIMRLRNSGSVRADAYDHTGTTALHVAAQAERSDVLHALCDRGSSLQINAPDVYQHTPLYYAAAVAIDKSMEVASAECVQVLLGHGAKLSRCDVATVLSTAARTGNLGQVRAALDALRALGEPTALPRLGSGGLKKHKSFQASGRGVRSGSAASNSSIFSHSNDTGSTPLHDAAREGAQDIVAFMLHHGAAVNALDARKLTPLYVAVTREHFSVARLLIAKGAKATRGRSMSHVFVDAVMSSSAERVQELLSLGCDPNAADADGTPALALSAERGSAEISSVLLDAGADVRALDPSGFGALDTALICGAREVATLLRARGATLAHDHQERVNASVESFGAVAGVSQAHTASAFSLFNPSASDAEIIHTGAKVNEAAEASISSLRQTLESVSNTTEVFADEILGAKVHLFAAWMTELNGALRKASPEAAAAIEEMLIAHKQLFGDDSRVVPHASLRNTKRPQVPALQRRATQDLMLERSQSITSFRGKRRNMSFCGETGEVKVAMEKHADAGESTESSMQVAMTALYQVLLLPFVPYANRMFSQYSRRDLSADMMAGLVIGVMVIPQGLAYGLLAGMPPVFGLYVTLFQPWVYVLFGNGKQTTIGPSSLVALLVNAAAVANNALLKEDGATDDQIRDEHIRIVSMITLLVAVLLLAMRLLRFSALIGFVSRPVLSGFTSGAALITIMSVCKDLVGISGVKKSPEAYRLYIELVKNANTAAWQPLIVSVCALSVFFLFVKVPSLKKIPAALVVVVIGTLASWLLELETRGVKVVGDVPGGLPSLKIPALSSTSVTIASYNSTVGGSTVLQPARTVHTAVDLGVLLQSCIFIALIGFIENVAISKYNAFQHRYEYDQEQDLMAVGLANIVGSMISAYPAFGTFSRSAANDSAGARTPLSGVFGSLVVILTLLFFTGLFYHLPKPILSAIVLVAVGKLVDFKMMRFLYRIQRFDYFSALVAFLSTVSLGVENGILISLLFSMLVFIYRTSRPRLAEIGRIEGSTNYTDISKDDVPIVQRTDVLAVAFHGSIFFGNVDGLDTQTERVIADHVRRTSVEPQAVIFDVSGVNDIDATGIQALWEIAFRFSQRNNVFVMAGTSPHVRDQLRKAGFVDALGTERFFMDVHAAMKACVSRRVLPCKDMPEFIAGIRSINSLAGSVMACMRRCKRTDAQRNAALRTADSTAGGGHESNVELGLRASVCGGAPEIGDSDSSDSASTGSR